MKHTGARAARRKQSRRPLATRPQEPATAKAAALVRLIDALVDGLGARGGARLGRGIATLLVGAYGRRGQPPPRWVSDLVAYYAPRNGGQ